VEAIKKKSAGYQIFFGPALNLKPTNKSFGLRWFGRGGSLKQLFFFDDGNIIFRNQG
jgi:hypothetical protein